VTQEQRTARLTVLIDPKKKAAFERLLPGRYDAVPCRVDLSGSSSPGSGLTGEKRSGARVASACEKPIQRRMEQCRCQTDREETT
jgi:hypothetical protein